ncbi:MAG: hypothetical protein AAF222_14065 [Pseudomonadota bacterium]
MNRRDKLFDFFFFFRLRESCFGDFSRTLNGREVLRVFSASDRSIFISCNGAPQLEQANS